LRSCAWCRDLVANAEHVTVRRVAVALWLLCSLALLPCALASEPVAVDAASQEDSALHITKAQLLSVPGTGYSPPALNIEDAALPSKGWQTVALPHTAARELVPTLSGAVSTVTDWYRIDFDALARSTQPRLLYLPRWKTLGHIAVYGDGVLLYQSHGSPVHNGYNHPLLLPLNATANTLSPGSVLVRVDRLRSSGSGFSSVWVGEQRALAWRYQLRQMLQVQLPFMGSAAFLAVGAFAFAVWLGKRRESLYLLFAAISALAFVRMLHYYVSGDYLPMSDEWFEWITVSALLWLIVLIHLFLQRLHQQPSPWLTRSSVTLALVCSVATLPQVSASIASLYLVTPLLNLAVLPVAVLIFAVDLRKALRAKLPAGRLVAGWTVFAVTFTSYDGLLQNKPGEPRERLYLALRHHRFVLRVLVHHVPALHGRVRRSGPAEPGPGRAAEGARGRAGAELPAPARHREPADAQRRAPPPDAGHARRPWLLVDRRHPLGGARGHERRGDLQRAQGLHGTT
jgi:hypothetical protein